MSVTSAVVTSKVYDGYTTAAITGATLSGVVGSDDVVLGNKTSGTFAQATIGNGISVTTSPMTLSGTKASNYSLTQPTLTGNITAKALTIASAAARNKVYDGTNVAVITGTLTGIVSPDAVTYSGTGTFASVNAGTGIAVASTCTLAGAKAGNYTLTQPTGLTANITQISQTIAFSALDAKTYGDPPFVVSATGGASGNPVTFTSSDATVATCSGTNGTTVTIKKAGSCSIYMPTRPEAPITAPRRRWRRPSPLEKPTRSSH